MTSYLPYFGYFKLFLYLSLSQFQNHCDPQSSLFEDGLILRIIVLVSRYLATHYGHH